jgi:signal transduction histidine kinase
MFPSLVARDQLPEAMDFLMAAQQHNAVFSRPFTIVTEEQEVRLQCSAVRGQDDILVTAVPVTAGDSGPDAVSALDEFTRLNNELLNMQRSMAKQNEELNRLNDLKNEFLGMAAHDMKGSLLAIELSGKILLREGSSDLDEEHLGHLRTISDTAESLRKLVRQYLDISTIEAGKLKLHFEPTDLKPVLERSTELNKVLAESKNISIQVREEVPSPTLMLDAEKILQVANNLIGNAVKFSPSGSEILVRISPSTSREVVFTVEDQGPGIEASDLQRIFEPYGRAGKTSQPQEKGAGLGLAIAKKIVEAHGGMISVASRLGHGCVFAVLLPQTERSFPENKG